jgi:hypothetical protein
VDWLQIIRKPISSRGTILALASFLVGLSFADVVDPSARSHLMRCGLVGMVAVIGLHFVALRREEQSTKRLLERETEKMQQVMLQNLTYLKQSLHARVKEILHEGNPGEPQSRITSVAADEEIQDDAGLTRYLHSG